jgi:hypothetical protein
MSKNVTSSADGAMPAATHEALNLQEKIARDVIIALYISGEMCYNNFRARLSEYVKKSMQHYGIPFTPEFYKEVLYEIIENGEVEEVRERGGADV